MDELNMKVNRLPVPTWNRLKMNGTPVSVIPPRGSGRCSASLPASAAERIGARLEIEGNAGADFQRLFDDSGAPARRFYVDGRADEPLRLDFFYENDVSALNGVELETAPGSAASLIMDYRGAPGASGLAAVSTKIRAGAGSSLQIVQIQRLGGGMRFFNDLGISCGEDAKVSLVQLVLDGRETFTGCRCSLDGAGSSFSADVGYRVRGEERLDMNCVAVHRGERTSAEMNVSGVLRDRAFKLFRGTIDFRPGAARSVGGEKEDVLLMDDGVVNQTIPLLLCAEEDVEGSHGATVGRLDDALLFYMESRGLSRGEIYEMMARARLAAVCGKISDEKLRRELDAYLNGGTYDE